MKITETSKPYVLDGAMGTELIRKGVHLPLPLWSAEANITHPETVLSIHQDYTAAGADIITTNTFRTTTYTYRKAGLSQQHAKERAKDSLMSAVDLARKAGGESIQVAGSMSAVEDCYSPDLFPGKGAAEDTYGEMVEWFTGAGVDILLFETMGNMDEIEVALSVSKNNSIFRWLSLILKDSEHLLDGTALISCLNYITEQSVSCLLMNCNKIETMNSSLDLFLSHWEGDWGLYPNLGKTDFENDYFDIIDETKFTEYIERYLDMEPTVIGACCGSTPHHIKQLKEMIDRK